MQKSFDLVTVATFETALEAWIFRSKLATNEFDAVVADEHVANMNWMYSGAIGGVKVRIPKHELKQFKAFLERDVTPELAWFTETPHVAGNHPGLLDRTCPKCDSSETSLRNWPKRINFLVWLIFGFVFPIYWPVMNCNHCGYSDRDPIGIPKQFNLIHLFLLMTVAAILLAWIQQEPKPFRCLTP